ncbi:hypothetical protein [Breznakiella homolactica]|uniref:Uncharacterized protein n=1 Tax=Breznakiella homolactica TaxID=2798577 RepID=A0A7T7XMG8_9SPIR|nr:hypothetical protein [Breznakiella homolactica]QQO08996.1 hypothetical protein JFL75_19010 [Breznakiella homolactica]
MAELKLLRDEQYELELQYPLIGMISVEGETDTELLVSEIEAAVETIREAQGKVEQKIVDGSFPVWQMAPVVAEVLSRGEINAEDAKKIAQWLEGKQTVETITGIVSFVLPIGLAAACFFMTGGTALLLPRILIETAIAGTNLGMSIGAYNEARTRRDMLYAQSLVEDAWIIDRGEGLEAAETAVTMSFISLAVSVIGFVDVARVGWLFYKFKSLPVGMQQTLNSLGRKGMDIVQDLSSEQLEAISKFQNSNYILEHFSINDLKSFDERVTVYRVEGTKNTRILIDSNGYVTVQGDTTLYLNFGDEARAQAFLNKRVKQNMNGATIKTFEVPQSVVEELRKSAVAEDLVKDFPDRPIIADPTKAADQYGIRPDGLKSLQDKIIQGSGKDASKTSKN